MKPRFSSVNSCTSRMVGVGAVSLVALAACLASADYTGTSFRCTDGQTCPAQFRCVDMRCVPADSTAVSDAGLVNVDDGGPMSLTLAPTADTFININTDLNGALPRLEVYTFPANQVANAILVGFDVSSIPPGSTVLSASLDLSLTDADTFPEPTYLIHVQKVVGVEPNLDEATGYDYALSSQWTANPCCLNGIPMGQADLDPQRYDSLAVDKVIGTKSLDVTELVQQWLDAPADDRILMISPDTGTLADRYRIFASTEHDDSALRPVLRVSFR